MRARTISLFLIAVLVLLSATWLIGVDPWVAPGWAATLSWTDLDGPTGGPAQALALNPAYPADPHVLAGGGVDLGYASWAGMGIFRSQDGGLTWAEPGGPSNGALFDVAYSSDWAGDGFAVAGLWDGVWATDDRGATWHRLSSLDTGGPAFVAAVAVGTTSAGDRALLAGGWYGALWRSTNDGATWTEFDGPLGVRRVRVHPLQPDVALAAAGNGLWRSADGGLSWTQIVTQTQIFDVAFAADGGAAYATYSDHLWRSGDDGLTWQVMPGLTASFLDAIGLSDDGDALFVAARGALYRYDFSTAAFAPVTNNLRTGYYLRLAPSPHFATDQTLLAATYDGVWISQDGGQTFARSDGFSTFPIRAVAAASNDPDGELFAGGEYGVWRRVGGAWRPANYGMGGSMASSVTDLALSPAYGSDGTLFVARSISVSRGGALYRSTDRGDSWEWLVSAGYIGQVELSPAFATDRRVFMVADQHLVISMDGGATWSTPTFWTDAHTARLLAISPNYVTDQTLYVVGNHVYLSHDGGLTWTAATSPPPIVDGVVAWQPFRLAIDADGALYLAIYRYDPAESYARHDQVWTSHDGGDTWSQVASAPDLPISALAVGPGSTGGELLYIAVFDDNEFDDRIVAPDLYVSGDGGAIWTNLGAVPGGPAQVLTTATGAAGEVLAGTRGVWLLDATDAPTATPDPCEELLHNRSFEYDGVWRIPVTAYSAARTTERHSYGYWSMRTGIVDATANVRSYSDFSQDVALPANQALALRFQRWSSAGTEADARGALPSAVAGATTIDAFHQALATMNGDLHYAMLIDPPSGAIHFLYLRLDNEQGWVDETFDLSSDAGKTVRLQFGTFNDGAGAVAAQYFDGFSLQACATPVMTPVETPISTPVILSDLWLPFVSRSEGATIPPPP